MDPGFLTLGDLIQCVTGLPSHFWVQVVVKHFHKMLIRGSRLPERAQLDQTCSQVSLGGQRAQRVVPQMALIHNQRCLRMAMPRQPVA